MQGRAVDYDIETRIADSLVSTTWNDLSPAARSEAVRAITWYLGIALEAVVEPGQAPLVRYVMAQGGRPEATIVGFGERTTAELAGLVNGRAGKAWEHEDKFWVDETIGFGVGCCVVPAALAAAEARGAVSGRELATAVALGIDLEARLIRPLGLGFVMGQTAANATFVLGNYGAAAAAGKVLGLDASGFLDALGLVHCQSCGNYEGQAEGRGVSLQGGFAVRNGVSAARLAAAGLPGPRASITGPAGLYAVHYPASTIDFGAIVEGLGRDFLGARLGYKGYPCGVVAHPAIDAVLAARPEVGAAAIRAIEVSGPLSLSIMADPIEAKRAPRSATEAQFSIPWAAACAMRDGYFSIDHYDGAALADPELQTLAAKVSVVMDAANTGTNLRIVLDDGRTIAPPTILASRGHPNNPMPTTEIEAVLARAADRIGLDPGAVNRATALLRDLPAVTDIGEIVELLSLQSAQEMPLPGDGG